MTVAEHDIGEIMTPEAVAWSVKFLRETFKWSQETLSERSGLSVRTIQRVEKAAPSDLDTRRALARAFEFEDIDYFNKPQHPTAEEVAATAQTLLQERLTLDCHTVESARELARAFAESECDHVSDGTQLSNEDGLTFAKIVDHLKDYREIHSLCSEQQKAETAIFLGELLGDLRAAGLSLCYTQRRTSLTNDTWADKTPLPVTIIYLAVFPKGKEPSWFMVPKAIEFSL